MMYLNISTLQGGEKKNVKEKRKRFSINPSQEQ